jgi:hypothetical protein
MTVHRPLFPGNPAPMGVCIGPVAFPPLTARPFRIERYTPGQSGRQSGHGDSLTFTLRHAKHGDEGWLSTDVMMKVIEHKNKRLFDMESRHSRSTGRSNATPLQSEGDSGVWARLGKTLNHLRIESPGKSAWE